MIDWNTTLDIDEERISKLECVSEEVTQNPETKRDKEEIT